MGGIFVYQWAGLSKYRRQPPLSSQIRVRSHPERIPGPIECFRREDSTVGL